MIQKMSELNILVGSDPLTVTYKNGDDLLDIAFLLCKEGYNVKLGYGCIQMDDGTVVKTITKPCKDMVYRFGMLVLLNRKYSAIGMRTDQNPVQRTSLVQPSVITLIIQTQYPCGSYHHCNVHSINYQAQNCMKVYRFILTPAYKWNLPQKAPWEDSTPGERHKMRYLCKTRDVVLLMSVMDGGTDSSNNTPNSHFALMMLLGSCSRMLCLETTFKTILTY